MKRDKNVMLLAFGLLLVSGSSLVNRFIFQVNDFSNGCIIGVGIGLMLVAVYRMKFRPTSRNH